jgi:hypothetical protein
VKAIAQRRAPFTLARKESAVLARQRRGSRRGENPRWIRWEKLCLCRGPRSAAAAGSAVQEAYRPGKSCPLL